MVFAKIYSAQAEYLSARIISVEVDISFGLHKFSIVGLTDKAIEESKDRISSAIKYSNYQSPKSKNQKILISLAPAHIKKNGPIFDLAIALGYLKASEEIDFDSKEKIFIGELSLDGNIKAVSGVLNILKIAKEKKFKEVFIPKQNVKEASLITGIKIFGISSLGDVVDHLNKVKIIKPISVYKFKENTSTPTLDFKNIFEQESAKRGLLIAAGGGHNIALYGPPGTGKTMLARAFSGIIPNLKYEQIIESTSIYSIVKQKSEIIYSALFRNPHHTASYTSVVGGGINLKPGEITLAHNGVLFLDEFPEFDKRVIEVLRQPLEDKKINIGRASGSVTFPCDFILIVAMNPCPCGFFKTNIKQCKCSFQSIEKYKKKISGPILDRIDIWIKVNHIENQKLLRSDKDSLNNMSTEEMQKIVNETREIQARRFLNQKNKLNSSIPSEKISTFCKLDEECQNILNQASRNLKMSIRSFYKVLKLSRTIADIEKSAEIKKEHLLEALQYRPKDLY